MLQVVQVDLQDQAVQRVLKDHLMKVNLLELQEHQVLQVQRELMDQVNLVLLVEQAVHQDLQVQLELMVNQIIVPLQAHLEQAVLQVLQVL